MSFLLALLLIKNSFAAIPTTFDAHSIENGHTIGWIKVFSCTEGGPQTPSQLSTFTYPNGDVATLANNYFSDAIAVQVLQDSQTPADMDFTNNPTDRLSVMTKMCSNPVRALNLVQELSYVIDPSTGLPTGVADMSNWMGSTEALSRLPQNDECTCALQSQARPFSSIIYHACCSHDGLHLNTINMCYWDWMGPLDNIAGEWEGAGISLWVGFDADGQYTCDGVCSLGELGAACHNNNDCPNCMQCCDKYKVCEFPPTYGSYSGEYVFVVSNSRDECQAECENTYGTDLATILTQSDIVKAQAKVESRWIGAIIGLTDRVIEGQFVWEDGTTCREKDGNCVDYWAPGQPDNVPDVGLNPNLEGDCVYLGNSQLGPRLTLEFVCEYDDPGMTPCLCNAPISNPAKQVNEVINKAMTTHIGKNKYNYYGYILLVGAILFVLINNIFIGYWCVWKRNSNVVEQQYGKCDIVIDDE